MFDEAARDLTPNDAYMAIDEKVIIILSWLLKRKIRVLLKRSSMGVDVCGESKASPDEALMYGLPVDDSWLPSESSARATLYLANRQSPPAHYDLIELVASTPHPGTSTGACPAAGDRPRGGLHSHPTARSSARPLNAASAGSSVACGAADASSDCDDNAEDEGEDATSYAADMPSYCDDNANDEDEDAISYVHSLEPTALAESAALVSASGSTSYVESLLPNLRRAFTESENKVVNMVSSLPDEGQDVVSTLPFGYKGTNIPLVQRDYARMANGCLVDGSVNAYMFLLKKREQRISPLKKTLFFDSYFIGMLFAMVSVILLRATYSCDRYHFFPAICVCGAHTRSALSPPPFFCPLKKQTGSGAECGEVERNKT